MRHTLTTPRPGGAGVGFRIGLDVASVDDVRAALQRWGDRYLSRVYTAAEIEDCRRDEGLAAERLAARFAAKEAVVKVLRPRRDDPLPWTAIAVHRVAEGAPEARLSGAAAQLAQRDGVQSVEISLTHEGAIAAAVALATFADPTGGAA